MTAVAALVILIVLISYKEWKLFLFDPAFAGGLGLSGKLMNAVYMAVLVTVIVIGIQAAGVVLMAALLIIPGVSARYWTDSFGRMIILSAWFGGGAGCIGTLASIWGEGWPTGPLIVIASACLFLVSLLLGLRKGLLVLYVQRQWQKRKLRKKSVTGQPGLLERGTLP
jgi:manganese/zinc/iron transport system permease protein